MESNTIEGVGRAGEMPNGCSCIQGMAPQFNYQGDVDIETTQVGNFVDKIIPFNGLSSEPYDFVIEPMADYFVDLGSASMYCIYQVVDGDGNALTDEDADVYPVDNLLSSMWSSIVVKVNDVELQPETNKSHPYRAIMEYLLSVERGTNNSYKSSGYGETDAVRKASFQQKKTGRIDLCGPIALDVLRADHHLSPGNKITLTFNRADSRFCIMSDAANPKRFQLVIHDVCLYVNRIKLRSSVASSVVGTGSVPRPTNYFTSHTSVKDYPLASGTTGATLKLHFGGQLPHQIIIGFVDTAAFSGRLTADPFKFEPFGLNLACLKVNGVRVPQDPLRPDWANGRYSRTYMHLFQNTGKYRVNAGNGISAEEFATNKFLIPFDLTPDQCNNFHNHASRTGVIDLELGWGVATTQAISVIAVSVYNQVIQLRGHSVQPVWAKF